MCHHDPLNLAMAVRCKFPIHTKLYILPTLLACWPVPTAQTSGVSTPKPFPLQIRIWQKYALTPLSQKTLFSFPMKMRGDVTFAQVPSWHYVLL